MTSKEYLPINSEQKQGNRLTSSITVSSLKLLWGVTIFGFTAIFLHLKHAEKPFPDHAITIHQLPTTAKQLGVVDGTSPVMHASVHNATHVLRTNLAENKRTAGAGQPSEECFSSWAALTTCVSRPTYVNVFTGYNNRKERNQNAYWWQGFGLLTLW